MRLNLGLSLFLIAILNLGMAQTCLYDYNGYTKDQKRIAQTPFQILYQQEFENTDIQYTIYGFLYALDTTSMFVLRIEAHSPNNKSVSTFGFTEESDLIINHTNGEKTVLNSHNWQNPGLFSFEKKTYYYWIAGYFDIREDQFYPLMSNPVLSFEIQFKTGPRVFELPKKGEYNGDIPLKCYYVPEKPREYFMDYLDCILYPPNPGQ